MTASVNAVGTTDSEAPSNRMGKDFSHLRGYSSDLRSKLGCHATTAAMAAVSRLASLARRFRLSVST